MAGASFLYKPELLDNLDNKKAVPGLATDNKKIPFMSSIVLQSF